MTRLVGADARAQPRFRNRCETPRVGCDVTNNARANWLVFIALGFFWGSSYLFIKIGVDAGLAPFTLVTGRLLIGTILLGTVVAISREQLPRDPRMYAKIA